ncbi:hypothetical protein TrRE_jg13121 [Triparma retinervis]|uniref:Uncharacterized protein n=1 Tax=Triparma retinervis TaxID=2557542 RepID=A0A9W7DSG5_9STRA|nr:hypothetical protein TrRE_jg13121 [Triparma retinervis]
MKLRGGKGDLGRGVSREGWKGKIIRWDEDEDEYEVLWEDGERLVYEAKETQGMVVEFEMEERKAVEEEEQGGLRIVDPHKMNLDGMGDFDENNIVAGKRRRKAVDYTKLNDSMFGGLTEEGRVKVLGEGGKGMESWSPGPKRKKVVKVTEEEEEEEEGSEGDSGEEEEVKEVEKPEKRSRKK